MQDASCYLAPWPSLSTPHAARRITSGKQATAGLGFFFFPTKMGAPEARAVHSGRHHTPHH